MTIADSRDRRCVAASLSGSAEHRQPGQRHGRRSSRPSSRKSSSPIDQLPPQEQLPAAPLLVGAYAFVLLMLFGYLFIVSRRLAVIQREVDRLDSDLKRTGRS